MSESIILRKSRCYKNAISFINVLKNDFLKTDTDYSRLEDLFFEYLKFLNNILSDTSANLWDKCVIDYHLRFKGTLIAFFDIRISGDSKEIDNIVSIVDVFVDTQIDLLIKRKKIVILTTKAGQGHESAAKGTFDALQILYGYDFEINIVSITQELGSLYDATMKVTPNLSMPIYRWFFQQTDGENLSIVDGVTYPPLAVRLDEMMEKYNPDIIVSTFCFFGLRHWLNNMYVKKYSHVPFINIITDSISIHKSWIADHISYYIVPNEETKEVVRDKGVPETKIKVLGFPVRPEFYRNYNREAELIKEGLDPKKITFLALSVTGGNSKDVKFLKDFDKKFGDKAQCIMIVAKNKTLFNKLLKQKLGSSVKLYNWVNDMYRIMNIADVVITKAGGAIVMECVTTHKPMIITRVYPGQEEGNAVLINKYQLGIIDKKEDISKSIEFFVDNPEKIKEFENNFVKTAVDKPAFKIAEFIQGLACR